MFVYRRVPVGGMVKYTFDLQGFIYVRLRISEPSTVWLHNLDRLSFCCLASLSNSWRTIWKQYSSETFDFATENRYMSRFKNNFCIAEHIFVSKTARRMKPPTQVWEDENFCPGQLPQFQEEMVDVKKAARRKDCTEPNPRTSNYSS